MQGLLPYIIRRLLWMPVVLASVTFLTFMITRFGPGDPVTIAAGQHSDPETVERIKDERGLDEPFYVQYAIYMEGLITEGDLGESFVIQRGFSSWELIWPRMLVSAQYGILALMFGFGIGIVVGLFAALRQGTWLDPTSIGAFLFFTSVPVVVILPFLVLVFVVKLGWLSAAGWGGPTVEVGAHQISLGIFSQHIILPVLVLSLVSIAGVARLVRAVALNVLGEDYVRTARAKGLEESVVVRRHVTRNIMLPLITVIGLSLITVLEGVFFVELILGIPGFGQLGVEAAQSQDYDVIQAVVLIMAFLFIMMNLLIDIAYAFIDPRIRLGGTIGARA